MDGWNGKEDPPNKAASKFGFMVAIGLQLQEERKI